MVPGRATRTGVPGPLGTPAVLLRFHLLSTPSKTLPFCRTTWYLPTLVTHIFGGRRLCCAFINSKNRVINRLPPVPCYVTFGAISVHRVKRRCRGAQRGHWHLLTMRQDAGPTRSRWRQRRFAHTWSRVGTVIELGERARRAEGANARGMAKSSASGHVMHRIKPTSATVPGEAKNGTAQGVAEISMLAWWWPYISGAAGRRSKWRVGEGSGCRDSRVKKACRGVGERQEGIEEAVRGVAVALMQRRRRRRLTDRSERQQGWTYGRCGGFMLLSSSVDEYTGIIDMCHTFRSWSTQLMG